MGQQGIANYNHNEAPLYIHYNSYNSAEGKLKMLTRM